MTKEQYIAKSTELARQQQELKKEYIATNSPIKPGTKVKVTHPKKVEYGILTGYTCEFLDIEPEILKLKKDGTPSKFKIYIFSGSKIEVCNE